MHRNTEVGVFPVTGHKQCLYCRAAACPRAPPASEPPRKRASFVSNPASPRKRELWTRGHLFTSRQLEKTDIRLFAPLLPDVIAIPTVVAKNTFNVNEFQWKPLVKSGRLNINVSTNFLFRPLCKVQKHLQVGPNVPDKQWNQNSQIFYQIITHTCILNSLFSVHFEMNKSRLLLRQVMYPELSADHRNKLYLFSVPSFVMEKITRKETNAFLLFKW